MEPVMLAEIKRLVRKGIGGMFYWSTSAFRMRDWMVKEHCEEGMDRATEDIKSILETLLENFAIIYFDALKSRMLYVDWRPLPQKTATNM